MASQPVTARVATPGIAPRGAPAAAALASVAIVLIGMLAVATLFDGAGWAWLLVPGIGFLAGAVGGRARLVWLAIVAVALWHAAALALGLPRDTGPFWYIAALGHAALLAISFVIGSDVGWRSRPLAAARRGWHGLGRWPRRLLLVAIVAALAAPVGYAGVILAIGPNLFTHPDMATDCRTPSAMYGWTYEAINYDIASDAALAPVQTTKDGETSWACGGTPARAGTAVVTSDGIGLAGWYVPAGSGAGPTAPTIVLVHGWKANKTGMLPFAAGLHADYNLVLFDLRNNGQSGGGMTSMGLWEQRDVTRMLDWLVAAKHPSWIGAVGNSMGAATVLAVAAADQRIRALILDSAHADVVTSFSNAMEEDFGFPGGPAAWVLARGVSAEVGGDITTTDPVRHIGLLGDRPVFLSAGANDQVDTPAEATERNVRAAVAAAVPVQVGYCQGARHGQVINVCPDDWATWARAFFGRASGA